MQLTSRRDAIHQVMADPPLVHKQGQAVWGTETSAYELMASVAAPGTTTLETGLGISTVLFTMWGTNHTCIVPSQEEVDTCRSHLESRGVDHSRTRFIVGSSTNVLPTLTSDELDLFVIDGCHGWPVPIVDWFYGASRLRRGGVLILDDTDLPSVSLGIGRFLERDSRWVSVRRTAKWSAYRREGEGDLAEEYYAQPFLGGSKLSKASDLLPDSIRPIAGRIGRKLGLL